MLVLENAYALPVSGILDSNKAYNPPFSFLPLFFFVVDASETVKTDSASQMFVSTNSALVKSANMPTLFINNIFSISFFASFLEM